MFSPNWKVVFLLLLAFCGRGYTSLKNDGNGTSHTPFVTNIHKNFSVDSFSRSDSFYVATNDTSNSNRNYAIIRNVSDIIVTKYPTTRIKQTNEMPLERDHPDEIADYIDILEKEATENVIPVKNERFLEEEVLKFGKHLEQSSVIYGLINIANISNLNPVCYKQLKQIQRSILTKQPWAIKVLDASGTKSSAFVFGHNYWLGSREACGAVQRPVDITLSRNFPRVMHYSLITETAPFDVDYRVVYLRHNSPWQVEIKVMSEKIIHIGLCLPRICTTDELYRLTTDYIEGGMLVENNIYDIRPEVLYVKDLQLNEAFYQKSSLRFVVGAFIGTLALIVCGVLIRLRTNDVESKCSENSNSSEHNGAELKELSTISNFVQSFDIISNIKKMFSTQETSAAQIPVINGLRSVSAIWIMIFHVMWFMYFTVDNKTFLLSHAEKIFFQYVSSAPLLVDVFFTISGFLLTYNFLRNSRQIEIIRLNNFNQNVQKFMKLLFHRYLRLAPLYLIITGVVDVMFAYIGDVSVYHINEHYDQICSRHWWRNLFFIQNLFSHNDLCLNWTWSLACEMQFFILATILLFVYVKNPYFVKRLTVFTFIATIVWSYIVGIRAGFQLSFDSVFATGTEIYINPFVRIMPYVMGTMAAWFLLEKGTQLNITKLREKCLWNLSIVLFFLCMYSTINRNISYFSSISLFVFGRLFFSISTCWMIVGSATGRGCWWSRILEGKLFQHTNRISYAFYLLNPLVIAFFFSLTSVSTHADPLMLYIVTAGFTVMVYLASVVFSLAFEMPYCNLSSWLLRRPKQKTI